MSQSQMINSGTSTGAARWRLVYAAVTMDQELLAGGRRTAEMELCRLCCVCAVILGLVL